jgi:hypothetical protein
MKKIIRKGMLLMVAIVALNGCSSDSNGSDSNTSEFAMTAKIEGVLHEMNNPYGTNTASPTTIFTSYPEDQYILLQGREGGTFGALEIDLWIKRTDLVVGTYTVNHSTDGTATHIDLIDNTNTESESTVAGTVVITDVNTTAKTVKGTFTFDTSDDANATTPIVNYHLTEGTFNFRYDVE